MNDHIIHLSALTISAQALSLVDYKLFCDLLTYNSQNKTKDADILYQTKITTSVLERVDEIRRDLAKELQV